MNSGPLLLDTNILLELVRNKDVGRQISSQFGLADAVHRPLISIVTVGEIWALADQFGSASPSGIFSGRFWKRWSSSTSVMSWCSTRM